MAGITVDAADIAASFRDELKKAIASKPIKPRLVGLLANADPAAVKYAEWTAKTCQETGVVFDLKHIERSKIDEEIAFVNRDPSVNGIIIYYPVFGPDQDQYLQDCISPLKDVEGLCHTHRFNLYRNIRFLNPTRTQKGILPCTPLAIIKVLEYVQMYNPILPLGNRLHGKTITIVNRSEIVGRPLAAMLANDGACVYSVDITGVMIYSRGQGIELPCHQITETSITLDEALPISDVVVTGVPSKDFKINSGRIKEGAICINVSRYQNFAPDVTSRAAIFVPSVGKVTVTMLERNLVRLAEYQQEDAIHAVS